MKHRNLYIAMLAGSILGFVAAFWQMLEKLALLKNGDVALSCDISSTLSCTNVLSAPQSAVFGFPNSLIGISMFMFFGALALVGVMGGKITSKLLLIAQGFAVFMLCFTLWFLWQSTYVIESICIFCLFIATAVLLVNFALFRINALMLPKIIQAPKAMEHGADIFVWFIIAIIIVGNILNKFYI